MGLAAGNVDRRVTRLNPVQTCLDLPLHDTASRHTEAVADNREGENDEMNIISMILLLLHVLLFFLPPSCVHVFRDLRHDVGVVQPTIITLLLNLQTTNKPIVEGCGGLIVCTSGFVSQPISCASVCGRLYLLCGVS